MAHDVFISYASQDKTIANAVCAALESAKIRCWIAPRDIRSGENWAEAISKAIKGSQVMVLLFTESSNQSKQVYKELTLAVNTEAVVVPFKIDDILPSGLMEFYLSDTHWLDAMNPPTSRQIQQLVETVQHTLGKEITAPKSLQDFDEPITVPAPDKQPLREKPPYVVNKKVGLIAAAAVAGAMLMLGGLYFAGLLPEIEKAEVEKAGVEEVEAVDVTAEDSIIIVTSAEDSGEGTLRLALQTARRGDVIVFDPEGFPPDEPKSIYLQSELPRLTQGNLTIDASNAGAVLDGSHAEDDQYLAGLNIQSSNNKIMGLQIINCRSYDYINDAPSGAGILIQGAEAKNNTIGGDRSTGTGPIGQGNLFAGNVYGIDIQSDAAGNVIAGNLIGTDSDGTNSNYYGGNDLGIVMDGGANLNNIGPDNIIAYNNNVGIMVGSWPEDDYKTRYNTITANSIYQNGENEIIVQSPANGNIEPPVIISVNLDDGTVRGTATPGCTIEIFSSSSSGGEIYEGFTETDESGRFIFSKDSPLWGPNITATATDPDGNSSEFSDPVSR